jgi:hypothetical protein
MSQFPPPSPFQPDYGLPDAYGRPTPEKPSVVTGLAVTGIILGSLGILCNGLGLLGGIFMAFMGKSPMFANAPVLKDPAINAFGIANSAIDLLLCIALLALCIAAFNLKTFAHSALMRWAIVAIIWATVAFIAQATWVLPATADFMLQQQPRAQAAAAGYRVGQVIGAGFVWLVYCTMPVLFLILWRAPRVLAAFGKTPGGAVNPGFPNPS